MRRWSLLSCLLFLFAPVASAAVTLKGWEVTVKKIERVGQSYKIAGITLSARPGKEIVVLTLSLRNTGHGQGFTERLSIIDDKGKEVGNVDQWGPEPNPEGTGTLSHPMPIFIDLNSKPHRVILAAGVELPLPQEQ